MTQKHDREFKLEAIRMASEEGNTAVEIERRLGISQPLEEAAESQGRGSFSGDRPLE